MKRNVTFQLEAEEMEKLKAAAKKENRTIASYLRNIVLKIINKEEK